MRQVRANGLRLHLEELGSRKSLRKGLEKGGGEGGMLIHMRAATPNVELEMRAQ